MQASINSHIQWLRECIKDLECQIGHHIDRHPGLRADVELIASIPGLGNTTAAKALAYKGDVRRLKSAKALAAFIVVTPRLKESGSSVRGLSMIIRSGYVYICNSLYVSAMVAFQYNPLIKAIGLRLKEEGLSPKVVISASMHKLVRISYCVLKARVMFDGRSQAPSATPIY